MQHHRNSPTHTLRFAALAVALGITMISLSQ